MEGVGAKKWGSEKNWNLKNKLSRFILAREYTDGNFENNESLLFYYFKPLFKLKTTSCLNINGGSNSYIFLLIGNYFHIFYIYDYDCHCSGVLLVFLKFIEAGNFVTKTLIATNHNE